MKIGFLGNANNYPFMLARAIRALGHEVVFVVDSAMPLNRPENRYKEIALPYPSWVIDCSPLDLWNYPKESSHTKKALEVLRDCDAVVLNEFGISLWTKIKKPAFALLTGTDLEILADPQYADFAIGNMGKPTNLLKRLWRWKSEIRQHRIRTHLLKLIDLQRSGIRNAVGISYFPEGMIANGDRLLNDLAVRPRRVFFLQADLERYQYTPYPDNQKLRIFNVARITWKKPRDYFLCELDYKGTDVLIRGLAMFIRQTDIPLEIRLVEKGFDIEITKQLIENEGISQYVVWLKEMDQSALYEEYKNADIVTEHFGQGSVGMGAFDAMAVGRPVIANGSPETFAEKLGEATPICHAISPEDVCNQLLRLTADRDLRETIGKQSRSYTEKYFTPERAAKIVLEKLMHAD